MEDIFAPLGAIVLIIGLMISLLLLGSQGGKSDLINTLCKKNTYDFCDVERYKLKENF